MEPIQLLPAAAGLLLAPLMFGVINRTKAVFAGRRGQPLLQAYRDAFKLLRKGATYSRTTTWVFRAGPVLSLAAAATALLLVPAGGLPGFLAFPGDLLLFAYLFCLMRFFTVAAALDTGSAFEGMGASREVAFSAVAEPAMFLALATVARGAGSLSLSSMLGSVDAHAWLAGGPELALISAALFLVLLAENCRIPFDDPNTHLELTMIHEVMVLDHGGPDLAFIQYAAALKFWAQGAVLVNIALPARTGNPLLDLGALAGGMALLAVSVGVVESTMARVRLLRVPSLLVGAIAMAGTALVLALR